MIGIQLKGRLGNQMFEYAAARTLAETLDCPLVVAGHTTGRRYGVVGHFTREVPGLKSYLAKSTLYQWNGILRSAFECGPSVVRGRVTELAMPLLRRSLIPKTFRPADFSVARERHESYDDAFWAVSSGTWLEGWFQSEGYFARNRHRVASWFSPREHHEEQLEANMSRWPRAPSEMVGIHIRRGDYASIRGELSDANQGWLLPAQYYREALEHVPAGAGMAVFSDDPDWAERELADRNPWVARGNDAVVDMLLLANCRWNITSNSSFSWWSGWLNRHPDKLVIAPRFHLGWRIGRWVPDGIQVDGWHYLEVSS